AYRLGSRLMTALAVLLGALVVLGFVFAGPLVRALAPGFGQVPGKTEATVQLTRVMLPFLPLVSFAAVAMGILNAHERYGTPAFAPAVFNLVTIVWAGGLWALGFPPAKVALGWAVGTLFGGLAQFLIQVPGLWRVGWRPRPEWGPPDPDLRAVASLMAPATVGLAAVQLHIFVGAHLASHEAGAGAGQQYALYALGRPRVPLLASAGAVATNLIVILTLHGRLGYRAIALGTALGSVMNAAVLVAVFESRVGGLLRALRSSAIVKMSAAAAIMA